MKKEYKVPREHSKFKNHPQITWMSRVYTSTASPKQNWSDGGWKRVRLKLTWVWKNCERYKPHQTTHNSAFNRSSLLQTAFKMVCFTVSIYICACVIFDVKHWIHVFNFLCLIFYFFEITCIHVWFLRIFFQFCWFPFFRSTTRTDDWFGVLF